MRQGKDGRSGTHELWDLQRKVLVEPTLGVSSRRPGTGIKDSTELVRRLWTDSIVAVVHREGNADLDARCHGFLKPVISVNRRMVEFVLGAHGLDDLGGETLAWVEDSPLSGGTKFNGLGEGRYHNTENRDNR